MSIVSVKDYVRALIVGERPKGTLDDYSPRMTDRTARIVVDAVEGARYDSRNFTSSSDLAADLERLSRIAMRSGAA